MRADEVANVAWDRRAPRLAPPDLPRPEEAKCVAVPRNNCFGLHEDQRRTPIRPYAGEPNPQQPVGRVQAAAVSSRSVEARRSDGGVQHSPAEAQRGFSGRMRLRRGKMRAIRRSNRGRCGSGATFMISVTSHFARGTVVMTRPTRFPLRVGAKRGCVQVSRAEDSAADPLTAGSRVFLQPETKPRSC